MRKTFIPVIGMLLGASWLASACSSAADKKPEASAGQSAAPEAKSDKPVAFSVFAPQSPAIENLETNKFTKIVQDKAKVQLKWSVVPDKALDDKKQLMMASGDYPEVLLGAGFNKADQMKYGQQGAFIALNDLIDGYAPNIKKAMTELPYLKAAMTAPNGKIYAIPKVNECFHCTYDKKMWINQKWLDNLKIKMPATTEEFYEVLKAFKNNDPNGNGKKDEVPFTTSDKMWGGGVDIYLMNAFIYDDGDSYFQVKDGKVQFVANQPEWKEGLKYLQKLYKEGLIDPASFTQNEDAVKQLANKEPDNVVGATSTALISYLYSPDDKTPRHKDFVTVPPLKGPQGVQQAGYLVSVSDGQFVITNKASKEQQIAAMRMADYLYSEEATMLTSWGMENDGWRKAKDGETDYNGKPAKFATIPKENQPPVQNDSWQQLGLMKMTNQLRESFAAVQDPFAAGNYEYRLWKESKKYEPFAKPEVAYPAYVFIDPADASAAAQLKTTIKDYVKSNMAQFITGKDIDKEWDSYVNGFKGLQLDKYLAIYQKPLSK